MSNSKWIDVIEFICRFKIYDPFCHITLYINIHKLLNTLFSEKPVAKHYVPKQFMRKLNTNIILYILRVFILYTHKHTYIHIGN